MVVFKLSPELADGEHVTVVDTREALLNAIGAGLDEFESQPGESFTVATEEMSWAEIEAVPEI